MIPVEELQKIFPNLSENILSSLIPSLVAELTQIHDTNEWTDDKFINWLKNDYNPRMNELLKNI